MRHPRRMVWIALALAVVMLAAAPEAQAVFIDVDIGSPGLAGSVSPAGAQPPGPVAVTGGGADIWGNSDQFNYWTDSWTGNFLAIARFTGMSGGSDGWRKMGIMARDGLAANAAYTYYSPTASNATGLQWRDSTGGGAAWTSASTGSPSAGGAPFWISLKRQGQVFTAQWAPDSGGVPGTWSTPGAQDVHTNPGLPNTVQLGLAVTAHNNGELTTGSFDNFSIQALANPVGRLLLYDYAHIGGAAYAYVPPSGPVQGPVHWELWRWSQTITPGVMSQWYLNYNANGTANLLAMASSALPHQDYLISQISWSNTGGGSTYPPETPFTGDMGNFSVRHYGQVLIPDDPSNPGAARTVRFQDHNDDWAVLTVDGALTSLNDGNWTSWDGTQNPGGIATTTLSLIPGWHDFEFFEAEGGGGDNARLLWDYDPAGNAFGGAFATVPTAYLRVQALTPAELLASGDYNVGDDINDGIFYGIGSRPGEDLLCQLTVSYQGATWTSDLMEFVGIPEPATCLLLAGGLAALLRRRRRSR